MPVAGSCVSAGDVVKKLVFDYEMRLSFSAPVTDHRFQLRCIPSTGPRQQVIDVEVKIQPETEL